MILCVRSEGRWRKEGNYGAPESIKDQSIWLVNILYLDAAVNVAHRDETKRNGGLLRRLELVYFMLKLKSTHNWHIMITY